MKPEEYSERTLELAGWPVHIVSYKLGDAYHAKADNVSPGAMIARAKADTKEAAEARVIEKAEERLAATRRVDV